MGCLGICIILGGVALVLLISDNKVCLIASGLIFIALFVFMLIELCGSAKNFNDYSDLTKLKTEIKSEKIIYNAIQSDDEFNTKNIKYIQMKKLENMVDNYNQRLSPYLGKTELFCFYDKRIFDLKLIEKDF